MFALGVYYYVRSTGSEVGYVSWIPLVLVMIIMFTFAVGCNPVPFMLVGELLPVKIRDIGSSIAFMSMIVTLTIFSQTYFPMVDTLGAHGTYWFYGFVLVAGIIGVYYLIPDTNG